MIVCPGGYILTKDDVRRIVREELADIERAKGELA